MKKKILIKKSLGLLLLLTGAYLAGAAFSRLSAPETVRTAASPAAQDWGLSFREEGEPPDGTSSIEELEPYRAFYREDTGEKVLYLTFDCGYENGNTGLILDALKKHDAPAAFFVVGHYLETNPDLVRRMAEEGHIVGNHTCHHPDMTQFSSLESFQKELDPVEELYREITGQDMARFYRPPQGKYSLSNLEIAKELGYTTVFWSLAYVDWDTVNQPSQDEAFAKLIPRTHPGAVVLLHNTSDTNGAILDELLTRWEEMGYRFASLEKLAAQAEEAS